MTDHVLIPLPGIGTLRLPDNVYRQYLQPVAAPQSAAGTEPGPQLLDAAATAERFSVPKSWLLENARNNAIPHQRIGRYVRFDPVALAAHLAAGSHPVSRR